MTPPRNLYSNLDQLLNKWGRNYIWRMQAASQLVSFVAASGGILFILWNVEFTTDQVTRLIIVTLSMVAFANLVMLASMRMVSPNLYRRIQSVIPAPHIATGMDDELPAWKEAVSYPWRFGAIAGGTALLGVVLPVSLYMFYFAGATTEQTIHVAIGGLLSAIILISVNAMLIEVLFVPVRLALLPESPERQVAGLAARTLSLRLQGLVATLIVIALLMVAPRGYQEAVNSMVTGGGNLAANLPRLQLQLSLISIIALAFSVGYTAFLAWSISHPLTDLISKMQKAQQGQLEEVDVIGTDDIGILEVYYNQMVKQLSTFQSGLERLVQERTAALEKRSTQLKIASLVAREAATLQSLDSLLTETVQLVSDRFGFYHTGIFLLDENNEFAVLRAASSEGGRKMLERGHRLEIGKQGIVGTAAYENRPHIAKDVGTDAVFFNNPDLPLTHSEAALPLTVRGRVIGILDIQSVDLDAFRADDIDLLQTLADQIALAIQNARLLEESRQAIHQLQLTTGERTREVWNEWLKENRRRYQYTPLGIVPQEIASTIISREPPGDNRRLDIPITLRGQEIGRIAISRQAGNAWGDSDTGLAQAIAAQVGLALENARLLDETRRRAAHEEIINDITTKLGRYLDPEALLQTAVRELHQLPDVSEVTVFLSPPETNPPPVQLQPTRPSAKGN
ncbi:MAG: GAF domain-containing protein [Chloroflexi bacterium]|nr:GAF domain-containing protein [Chloroflexota bacterium]